MAAFQLVIPGGPTGADGVTVAIGDFASAGQSLSGEPPRMYIELPTRPRVIPAWYRRAHPGGTPRELLDRLVPLGRPGGPPSIRIEPSTNAVVWVEIRIPPGAKAGQHESTITVQSAGHSPRSASIWLDVLPIALAADLYPIVLARVPAESDEPGSIRTGADVLLPTPAGEQARARLIAICDVLADHHLSPYVDGLFPAQRGGTGTDSALQLAWDDYDRFVAPLLDGSAMPGRNKPRAWPIPVDHRRPDPEQFGGIESAVYARVLRETMAACVAHFDERGWLDRNFIDFGLRLPVEPTRAYYAQVRRLGRIADLVDRRVRFVANVIPQAMGPYGWIGSDFEDLSAAVDVFAPPAQFIHMPTLESLRRQGRTSWLVPDQPPFSGTTLLVAPPTAPRMLPWQAFLMGHETVWLRDSVSAAALAGDPRPDASAESLHDAADLSLLYPPPGDGVPPTPSFRLKQLMLGLQEAAILRVMEQRNRGATARELARSLVKAAGTEAYVDHFEDADLTRVIDDPEAWDEAARIACREVAGGTGQDPLSADWARLHQRTRKILAWVEGSRITADASDGGSHCEITLAVRNDLATPLDAVAKPVDLPRAWSAVGPPPRFEAIGPGSVGRQRVRLAGQSLAADDKGHILVPIQIEAFAAGRATGMGASRVTAVVSCIAPRPVISPPTIDGRLDDWVAAESSTAGGFILVSTPQAGPSDGSTTSDGAALPQQASSPTLAFVAADDETLYIGLRCEWSAGAGPAGSAEPGTSAIRYDDLIPTGEELCEIILDPTNAGTSIADIFHLVIKPSGVVTSERGVDAPRSPAPRSPWAADQRSATTRDAAGWTAELAIPRASFGPNQGRSRVWGFNVTRLDERTGQYSNWAAASRYCYHPSTLGNLLMVPMTVRADPAQDQNAPPRAPQPGA